MSEAGLLESQLSSGQRIGGGRFQLEQSIGRGGMGSVWRARDLRLNETVALKFISERIRGNPESLAALRVETSRNHSLSHHNIVRVHDMHEVVGEPAFISMEYVDGKNLHELRPQPNGAFTLEEVARWVRQLCTALSYAHLRGVIHRDLKPANFIIDRGGDLKLADFGLAAALWDPSKPNDEIISGTPAYMSPQQFAGMPATASDDIYSLGASLFELLAGVPPFEGRDLRQQIEFQPAPLLSATMAKRGLRNAAPEAFEDLILQALSKNPQNRPKSVDEFLEKATKALGGENAEAQEDLRREKRRRGKLLLATAAATVTWIAAAAMMVKASKIQPLNLKNATARASSSLEFQWPANAFDGTHRSETNEFTRWVSGSDIINANEWIAVDLGADMELRSVVIDWELAYAKDFTIRTRTSAEGFVDDPNLWTEQGRITGFKESSHWAVNSIANERDVVFDFARGEARVAEWMRAEKAQVNSKRPVARHVMVNPTARGINNPGVYSIYEIEITAKKR